MAWEDFVKSASRAFGFSKTIKVDSIGITSESTERVSGGNSPKKSIAEQSERYWNQSLFFHNGTMKQGKVVGVANFRPGRLENAPEDMGDEDGEDERIAIKNFIAKPVSQPNVGRTALIYKTVEKILVHGSAAWEITKRADVPKGFHAKLLDGFVEAKPDEVGDLPDKKAYQQKVGRSGVTDFDADQIILFNYPDPFSTWSGKAVAPILSNQISMEIQSEQWNLNFYNNHAIPAGLFTLPEFIQQDEFDAAKQKLQDAYMGVGNSNKSAIIVSGQVEFKKIQSDPNEAQLGPTRDRIKHDMLATIGTPPSVLGYSNNEDKEDVANSENRFINDEVTFLQNIISEQVNVYLQTYAKFEYYGLMPKTANIANTLPEVTAVQRQYEMGLITLDEARERFGLPPIGGKQGNTLLIPNTPLGPVTVSDAVGDDGSPETEESLANKPKPTSGKVRGQSNGRPVTEES